MKIRNVFLITYITLETHLGIHPDHNLCCSQNMFSKSLLGHAYVYEDFYTMVMIVLDLGSPGYFSFFFFCELAEGNAGKEMR